MRVRALTAFLTGFFLFVIIASGGQAQSITDKAKRDETVRVAKSDPLMEAAKQKGRSTLPEFLATARAPKPSMSTFAVKVGIPAGQGLEYVWVRPFEKRENGYVGRLRNDVQSTGSLKVGDTVSFGEGDIIDWSYLDDGKMKGNFTACALLEARPKEDKEAFKQQYGLDCERQ
jgi:uncharacterized protein YegJ (DUF2314 family)